MAWTITSDNFSGATLAVAGIKGLRITLATGLADAASFTVPAVLGTAPFVERETVLLSYAGTVVFRGFVRSCAGIATGGAEAWHVELAGVGQLLEICPYLQMLPTSTGAAEQGDNLTLGYSDAGARQNIAQVLTQIMADSVGRHGIAAGTLLSGYTVTAPLMTVTDVKVAEALRRVLAWVPDAVMWIDHAAGTLQISRPAALSVVTRAGSGNGSSVTANERDGRRRFNAVDGVQIIWATTATVDGVELRGDPIVDSAGVTTGPWVPTVTIPLNGGTYLVQREKPVVGTIPEAPADVTADFIKQMWPEITALNPAAGQLSVKSVTQTIDEDSKMGLGGIPTRYPRYLIAGAVPPWQNGISAATVDVAITIVPGANFADNEALRALFPGNSGSRTLHVRLTGTDAQGIEYSQTTGGGDAEEPITGLAAAWWEALQAAAPAGSFRRVGAEPDLDLRPGKKLTLTGELAVTGAVIQTVTHDVDAGETLVSYGPVGMLQPADLAQLSRVGTRRGPTGIGSATNRTSNAAPGKAIRGGVAPVVNTTLSTAPRVVPFGCRLSRLDAVVVSPGIVDFLDFTPVGASSVFNQVQYEFAGGELTGLVDDDIIAIKMTRNPAITTVTVEITGGSGAVGTAYAAYWGGSTGPALVKNPTMGQDNEIVWKLARYKISAGVPRLEIMCEGKLDFPALMWALTSPP